MTEKTERDEQRRADKAEARLETFKQIERALGRMSGSNRRQFASVRAEMRQSTREHKSNDTALWNELVQLRERVSILEDRQQARIERQERRKRAPWARLLAWALSWVPWGAKVV